MTIEKWLDEYTGWCETYQARLRTAACKANKALQPKCKGCKGLVPAGGAR